MTGVMQGIFIVGCEIAAVIGKSFELVAFGRLNQWGTTYALCELLLPQLGLQRLPVSPFLVQSRLLAGRHRRR